MRMVDLIRKKREGEKLSEAEIRFLIGDYTAGIIPDYQMSAFAMAVLFRGMDAEETAILTDAMMRSGDTVDLSCFGHLSVDKHSTGGVGDKTTLIVAPLVASLGGNSLGQAAALGKQQQGFDGRSDAFSPAHV